jgi:carboxypeptidase C (cathepsin A)
MVTVGMKNVVIASIASVCLVFGATAFAATRAKTKATHGPSTASPHNQPKSTKSVTDGRVTIGGQQINYTATAGTIILRNHKGQPTGSMFYVAYVKSGVANESDRPITFFYNGGPGSSTIWLHMGAFGPVRVVTADHTHTPPPPYRLVNNDYSLLDVTDEVFIDMMGTGYSRIIGKDQGGVGTKKDFYGVDADVREFTQFINRYLRSNGRWNSPRYIYGESYGTIRSMARVNYLEQRDFTDLNGVILQSATTSFGRLTFEHGHDINYALFLPSYAATAWYYHKLPSQPAELEPFLQKVQHFALHSYVRALAAGSTLSSSQFNDIAEKLHDYTGLDIAYIKRANLRVTAGEFFHELLADKDLTVGRLDSRFAGPSMNPMSQGAKYDPQAAAISSAYASAFQHYVHHTLGYRSSLHYRPEAYKFTRPWNGKHVNLVTHRAQRGFYNVGVDLAQAMKRDPNLQVLVNCGYYDIATPYYGIVYEMEHLRIPSDLDSHIHFKFYKSGHMIYVHIPALRKLHKNTAAFIEATDGLNGRH